MARTLRIVLACCVTLTASLIRVAAAPPLAPAPPPAVSKWVKSDKGVAFTLADRRLVSLVVRSPLAVRLSWSPWRAGKPEDWLIVPSASPDQSFTVSEVGGNVVVATAAMRLTTPKAHFDLRASTPDGKPVAALPLADGNPLQLDYAANAVTVYEDTHDYVWSYAPSATRLELLRRYIEATGAAPMPPKWVMGIAYGSYGDEAALPVTAAKWRELKLPVDAIWGDGGVFSHRTVNDFTSTWQPQSLAKLHDLHFALGRWIMHSTRPGATTWDELSSKGWIATDAAGRAGLADYWSSPTGGYCPDPFQPAARAAYKADHAKNQGLNAGFNFFKVDFRDVKYGKSYFLNHTLEVPSGFQVPMSDAGGMDAVWRLMLSRATFEATRDLNTLGHRGWVLTKYPVAGYQRYYCVWPDDHHGEFADLHQSVDMMLQYARFGLPWYCDDLGGFKNQRMPTKELFLRWFEYGVFTPWPTLFGKAQQGLRVPWEYDEDAIRIFRKYDELRYRLIPYLYTYAHEAHATGRPIAVPVDMAYPADPKLRQADGGPSSANYLFGGEILVAPIVEAGVTSWPVYLPAGEDWIEFETGKLHAGGTIATVQTPLDAYPLFVKAGAVIPMGREGKQYVADGGIVDSSILWNVYLPGLGGKTSTPAHPAAAFTLYEDDGLSADYEKGRFGQTRVTVRPAGERDWVVEQSATAGDFDGKPATRTYDYQFHGVSAAPARVTRGEAALQQAGSRAALEGGESGWFYDAPAGALWVRAAAKTTEAVTFTIHF